MNLDTQWGKSERDLLQFKYLQFLLLKLIKEELD